MPSIPCNSLIIWCNLFLYILTMYCSVITLCQAIKVYDVIGKQTFSTIPSLSLHNAQNFPTDGTLQNSLCPTHLTFGCIAELHKIAKMNIQLFQCPTEARQFSCPLEDFQSQAIIGQYFILLCIHAICWSKCLVKFELVSEASKFIISSMGIVLRIIFQHLLWQFDSELHESHPLLFWNCPQRIKKTIAALIVHVMCCNDSHWFCIKIWCMPIFPRNIPVACISYQVIQVVDAIIMAEVHLSHFVLFNPPNKFCLSLAPNFLRNIIVTDRRLFIPQIFFAPVDRNETKVFV
jgi:hypothetical protein